MTALLIVRAVVADPGDRAKFDHWYQTEHLPDAVAAFQAQSAMRGWSLSDPSVHTAFYRFETVEAAQSATSGNAIKGLIAEFDRVWGNRVTRGRDVLSIADEMKGPP